MHLLSILYAVLLLAIGVFGILSADDPLQVRALALPGLFFGGAVLFSSFYALKEPRHGLAGASFLVFLAFLTTGGTFAGHLTRGSIDLSHPAQRITTAICATSALYLAAGLVAWKRKRRARAIAELEGGE